RALPHFNEVDQGVAVDALVTNRVWTAMGLDPATTLHDVRWGDEHDGRYVWTLEISGSVPASHLPDGYASAEGWRQGPVFFPAGGRGHAERDLQARPCGVVAGLHRRGIPARGPRPCRRRGAARRGGRPPQGDHQPRVARDVRRVPWRQPRPVHGPPQGEPRAG